MSDPLSETIIARVVTVFRAIDGGAYTATVRSRSISGSYTYDLSDDPTGRVIRGDMGDHTVDGAQVYLWVDFSQPPAERTLCDDTATLTLAIMAYAVTEADTGDERQKAGLRLAHDLKTAIDIDYGDKPEPAGGLGTLNIYSIQTTVQEFQGQSDSVAYADPGVVMQVVIQYNLPGGVGL